MQRGNTTLKVVAPLGEEWTDDYGELLPGAPSVEDRTEDLAGCAVWPHTSGEQSGRSGTVTEGYTVVVGATAVEVTAQHEVIHLGETWRVDGEPGHWTFLDGSTAGYQFEITRGQG